MQWVALLGVVALWAVGFYLLFPRLWAVGFYLLGPLAAGRSKTMAWAWVFLLGFLLAWVASLAGAIYGVIYLWPQVVAAIVFFSLAAIGLFSGQALYVLSGRSDREYHKNLIIISAVGLFVASIIYSPQRIKYDPLPGNPYSQPVDRVEYAVIWDAPEHSTLEFGRLAVTWMGIAALGAGALYLNHNLVRKISV